MNDLTGGFSIRDESIPGWSYEIVSSMIILAENYIRFQMNLEFSG